MSRQAAELGRIGGTRRARETTPVGNGPAVTADSRRGTLGVGLDITAKPPHVPEAAPLLGTRHFSRGTETLTESSKFNKRCAFALEE